MTKDNVQEPVGYFYLDEGQWKQASDPIGFAGFTKLYKYPPAAQRQWVGLTVSDWDEISDMPDSFDQGVVWAVRKLKEKNT